MAGNMGLTDLNYTVKLVEIWVFTFCNPMVPDFGTLFSV